MDEVNLKAHQTIWWFPLNRGNAGSNPAEGHILFIKDSWKTHAGRYTVSETLNITEIVTVIIYMFLCVSFFSHELKIYLHVYPSK